MRPRLFVASSKESVHFAHAIQENLETDAEVTVWSQGVFQLAKYTLESLLEEVDRSDFGCFVFTPEDVLTMREQTKTAVRDNVIFETGLFVGGLGRERCFLVVQRGIDDFHMPTDFLGLTAALFEAERQDKNWSAALGPASTKIRERMVALGHRKPAEPVVKTSQYVADGHDDNDALSILETWMGSRTGAENTGAIVYREVDELLKLKPGSTEKHIEAAALRWRYRVLRKGLTTIKFEDRSPGS